MLFAGGWTHLQTYKLTYTQIFSQYSGISSHSFGRLYTLALYDVYMTREVISLDRIFNGYWKSLATRMYAQPAKIRNLMLSVKRCIRQ